MICCIFTKLAELRSGRVFGLVVCGDADIGGGGFYGVKHGITSQEDTVDGEEGLKAAYGVIPHAITEPSGVGTKHVVDKESCTDGNDGKREGDGEAKPLRQRPDALFVVRSGAAELLLVDTDDLMRDGAEPLGGLFAELIPDGIRDVKGCLHGRVLPVLVPKETVNGRFGKVCFVGNLLIGFAAFLLLVNNTRNHLFRVQLYHVLLCSIF
nr:MAG TPA: hypothetical protein [Bacteriophage sp.]